MTSLCGILWLFALFLPQIASAHAPYLDQRWACTLEGGFRVTFLYGDGIIGPDPRALVVLGAQGRLWAYEDVSHMTFPYESERCSVLDVERGQVITPHPPSFKEGPVIVGTTPEVREARWAFEPPRGTAWGMTRNDGQAGALRRIWVQFRYLPVVSLVIAGMAALVLFVAGALSFGVAATWPVWLRWVLGLGATGGAGLLCLFLFAILAFAGAPIALTVVSLAVGGVLGGGIAGLLAFRR